MANYVNLQHLNKPFTFESLAYSYRQEAIDRPLGYPYYLWIQTDQGSGIFYIKGMKYILREGEGILIPPFIPHKYHAGGQCDWYTNFISFSGFLSYEISNIFDNQDYFLVSDNSAFSFSSYIRTIVAEDVMDELSDYEQLSAYAYTFLMMLQKYSGIDKRIFSSQYKMYLLPVLKMIRTQYSENLTVQMMADSVYISQQYLGKLFKRFLGVSAYQYLKTYRLNRAKELLITYPSLSLNDICYKVGFSDVSRFIQTFKHETGFTPRQYVSLYIYRNSKGLQTTLTTGEYLKKIRKSI